MSVAQRVYERRPGHDCQSRHLPIRNLGKVSDSPKPTVDLELEGLAGDLDKGLVQPRSGDENLLKTRRKTPVNEWKRVQRPRHDCSCYTNLESGGG